MDLAGWLAGYVRAGVEGDADRAAALFTEDAVYRSHRFAEPYVGRKRIRDYWDRVASTHGDVRTRLGRPVADGNRVAVEWWTTMESEEGAVTYAGCLFLTFAEDGLCRELRECWHVAEGLHDPPPGWGD